MKSKQIKEKLIEASQKYYEGNPIMTDEEYDVMFDEFVKKNPGEVILGYKPTRERTLDIPMFSLDKVGSVDEVVKWIKAKIGGRSDIMLILTPKYDGISLCVDELNSPERRMATTRGSGTVGQECDMHYSFMNNGDTEKELSIISFGEAIMSKKAFAKYDKANGGLYKNARNLVGSQINADKPITSILKDVDYIRYGAVGEVFKNKSDCIDYLNNELNTVKVPYHLVNNSDFTHELIMELFNKWSENHELDGIVVEVNSIALQKSLGRERSGNPAYSRKYKGHFENVEITCVEEVVWQVSKHGKLKPVVNVESVRLSGADVTKVSGYNARNIIDNKIGIGAIVSIKRSGAVIPKIVEVHNPSDEYYLFPLICPSCSHITHFDENEVDLMCYNDRCPEMNVSRMTSFFSILNCKEVGSGTMKAFWDGGYGYIADVLAASVEDIMAFDKYGKAKAEKVYREIHACLDGITMASLMHASGCFKDIGAATIQLIMDGECTSQHDISEYNEGKEAFNEFYEGIKNYVKISGVDTVKTNKLATVNAVFTGFRDTNLEKVIVENGGKIGSGVTAKTTHLVMSFVGSGTIKEQKALQLGKIIMTGDEFKTYIESIVYG